MRISEIYASLQGEGLLSGTPSTFVRTSGCNLRCRWCDTPFTSWTPTGDERTVEEILRSVASLPPRHVVITGGEPLLVADLVDLCRRLRAGGHHVTIETAGTVPLETPVDLMSISPKLASSAPDPETPSNWRQRHEATRRRDEIILGLLEQGPYQLKFVVETDADIEEALGWVADLAQRRPSGIDPARLLFMPQGRTPEELGRTTAWLAGECIRRGLVLAGRHQITWFGNTRGT